MERGLSARDRVAPRAGKPALHAVPQAESLPPQLSRAGKPVLHAPACEPYARAFHTFHDALQTGRFRKLVLSYPFETVIRDPEALFHDLLAAYPHSLVYMAYTPEAGLWVGASPEVLLKGAGRRYATMSLAGTKTSATEPWDEKNRREQALVTSYIRQTLQPLADDIRESAPHTLATGALYHLCTDFDFRLRPDVKPEDVVAALHPTPAVCGLPKDEALRFILSHEPHPRRYYAGYVGLLSEAYTQLHVNIRCAHIRPDGTATVYAGSGLLPTSRLEDEWDEVRHKAQSIIHPYA